jgi:hypothetical protein
LTAFALVVPDLLVRLLYGAAYARAAIPFVIFLLALPARVANYGIAFRALGRTRAVLVWTATGLVVNLAVTVTLVLVGRGTIVAFAGPAAGYLVGYYATVVVVVLLLHRLMDVPVARVLPLGQLAPLALLSLVSGIAAFLVRLLPIGPIALALFGVPPAGAVTAALTCALAAIAFGACYLAVGLATGTYDEGERRLLAGLPLVRAIGSVVRPRGRG